MHRIGEFEAKIRGVLERLPKEAEVTRVEYEGPRVAIYAKKPEVLLEQSYLITDIVSHLRKRVVVRSDPSVRMSEPEAEKIIRELIPPEAEVESIVFDPTIGEVYIEAKKPGMVIGKNGMLLQEIVKRTKWRAKVFRAPSYPSNAIRQIRYQHLSETKERERILRTVGERIFRPLVIEHRGIRLVALGGSQQVGRSAFLVDTGESRVLLDCGVNPGTTDPREAFPRLDLDEFDLSELDAVVITHAHLDHCGFLPFLYKYGYDGPVYCSEPTLSLMVLLQQDYISVLNREGYRPPYDQRDIRSEILHAIPLRYGAVTDIAPDVRLTLHNAGHIIGSAIVHLHVGDGLHNIVYTGDFKFAKTTLLDPAVSTFPRAETLIMEATYGGQEDVMPPRKEVEEKVAHLINETIKEGGKVLLPVLAVGRAQELLVIINEYMRRGEIAECPVYIDGMISEVNAIHTAYPEYLQREIRDLILHQDLNPFQSEFFEQVTHPSKRPEIAEGGPCIIMATSGMLEGGPAVEYLRYLAHDPRNRLMFSCFQIAGTRGRSILNSIKLGRVPEVELIGENGRVELVQVKMKVDMIDGLSGHSDRKQLINYIKRMSPKPSRIIICHGEKGKCLGLASSIQHMFRAPVWVPDVTEAIKLA